MNLQFSAAACASCLDGAEDASGQQKNRGDELKCAMHYKADKPEGKQDQPNKRIENERRNCDGPADDKQDAEKQQLDHGLPP
jgi:hypothetical protein